MTAIKWHGKLSVMGVDSRLPTLVGRFYNPLELSRNCRIDVQTYYSMESTQQAVVEARELKMVYRDFWRRPKVIAVDGISFDLLKGEVLGLLGPNGSGKSTTLRMILGLLFPTSGSLCVLGSEPTRVQTHRQIGYLPEENCLYPFLTIDESLDFYGNLFRLPSAILRERRESLLELTGLQEMRRRPIRELSKGLARRAGLAQALINDPDLLVLDEPTAGLDPMGRRMVKELVIQLAGKGKTVLLCSHLLAEVEDVCNRVVIMFKGRVRAQGSVRELLADQTRNCVSLPNLTPGQLKNVLSKLREIAGPDVQVEHPRQTLEDYFLHAIQEALPDRKS